MKIQHRSEYELPINPAAINISEDGISQEYMTEDDNDKFF